VRSEGNHGFTFAYDLKAPGVHVFHLFVPLSSLILAAFKDTRAVFFMRSAEAFDDPNHRCRSDSASVD
jgi:hypothetical protein